MHYASSKDQTQAKRQNTGRGNQASSRHGDLKRQVAGLGYAGAAQALSPRNGNPLRPVQKKGQQGAASVGYEHGARMLPPSTQGAASHNAVQLKTNGQREGTEADKGTKSLHSQCWDLAFKCEKMGIKVEPETDANGSGVWVWRSSGKVQSRWSSEEFVRVAPNILKGAGGTWTGAQIVDVVNRYIQWAATNYILPSEKELIGWNRKGERWPKAWNKNDPDPNWMLQAYMDAAKNVGPGLRLMAAIMGYTVTIMAVPNLWAVALYSADAVATGLAAGHLAMRLSIHGAQLTGAFSARVSIGALGPNQLKYFTAFILKNEDILHRFCNSKGGGIPFQIRMDAIEIIRSTVGRS